MKPTKKNRDEMKPVKRGKKVLPSFLAKVFIVLAIVNLLGGSFIGFLLFVFIATLFESKE